jgi:ABC-type amino acid transport substrate-binding protein
MDDFNAELAAMKEDGTIEAIVAKYIGNTEEEAAEETDAE